MQFQVKKHWKRNDDKAENISCNSCSPLYKNFEDIKHTRDSWLAVKPNLGLDFPNLPYLIDGDVKMTECKAITLYICERWAPELLGATVEDKATAVMLQNVLSDYFIGTAGMSFTNESRDAAIDKAMETIGPIVAFLGSNDFIVGNSLTFVDLLLWEIVETVLGLCQDTRLFTANPTL